MKEKGPCCLLFSLLQLLQRESALFQCHSLYFYSSCPLYFCQSSLCICIRPTFVFDLRQVILFSNKREKLILGGSEFITSFATQPWKGARDTLIRRRSQYSDKSPSKYSDPLIPSYFDCEQSGLVRCLSSSSSLLPHDSFYHFHLIYNSTSVSLSFSKITKIALPSRNQCSSLFEIWVLLFHKWESQKKFFSLGKLSQIWVDGVADSQTAPLPLNHHENRLLNPNFTFRVPKTHKSEWAKNGDLFTIWCGS